MKKSLIFFILIIVFIIFLLWFFYCLLIMNLSLLMLISNINTESLVQNTPYPCVSIPARYGPISEEFIKLLAEKYKEDPLDIDGINELKYQAVGEIIVNGIIDNDLIFWIGDVIIPLMVVYWIFS